MLPPTTPKPLREAASPVAATKIPEPVAEVAPPPLPEEYVAAHAVVAESVVEVSNETLDTITEEDEAEEEAEENEGGPAIAPGLDDEEDRDIQAMILGDIEGIDTVEEEEGE